MIYTGAALTVLPRISRGVPANDKLNLAAVGVRGQGASDLARFAESPNLNFVAFCDVDDKRLAEAAKTHSPKHPGVKTFADWRRMFDQLGKSIDGVMITTPDHMHAPIAMTAMALGKHVYCQKPLAHDLHEVRRMTLKAREQKVVTQMGIQIHSTIEYRTAVGMIQSGAIGKVKEVHVWTHKAWGGGDPPKQADPVPAGLHWDLWLGTAPEREFSKAYHPAGWRRFLDFGTGGMGDMGCHLIDTPMTALKLGSPLSATAKTDGVKNGLHAGKLVVAFTFAGTDLTTDKVLPLTFYQVAPPPRDLVVLGKDQKFPEQGSLFVGEKGMLLLPHINAPQLFPTEQFKGFARPKLKGQDHYLQWVEACRGNGQASTPFDYAGLVTEAILLGVLSAQYPGQRLDWDPEALKITNFSDANAHLKREYRKGWDVAGL